MPHFLLDNREWTQALDRLARRLQELSAGAVGESRRRNVDERLVQCVWFDRLFRGAELQTASGKALAISNSGRWNLSAGPDFLGASVRLAGEERRGDVEIHVESVEWHSHAHHADPAYNDCVLHAFLWASDDRPYDILEDGRRIERLELGHYLEPDLETLRKTIHPEDYPYGCASSLGRCHSILNEWTDTEAEKFLEAAGRERLEAKVRRMEDQLRGISLDQLFYQSLMTLQGHKASKTLYFLLSKRAPLRDLLDFTNDFAGESRARAILAILLHVGGLLEGAGISRGQARGQAPGQTDGGLQPLEDQEGDLAGDSSGDSSGNSSSASESPAPDEETLKYAAGLEALWRGLGPYFSDRLIPPARRWWRGCRPANFPARRLAAAAEILSRLNERSGPSGAILDSLRGLALAPPESEREAREILKRLEEIFTVDSPENYWSRHFTLGGKRLSRPLSLMGGGAAQSLVFNTVLPLGILASRQKGDAALERGIFQFARLFPALAPNEITTFMERRLFGGEARTRRLFKREIRRQGLFQVFQDCCNNNERNCDECLLMNREAPPGESQAANSPNPALY